jgi:hypothetical protein
MVFQLKIGVTSVESCQMFKKSSNSKTDKKCVLNEGTHLPKEKNHYTWSG